MWNRLTYQIERWIQRGAAHQLLLIAGLVAAVALVGGGVVWLTTGVFSGLGESAWWAFLRLTDPGYLGDDEGAVLRTVSTTVTILGYVLFMGSLIAIMTQWLSSIMRTLEAGLTPIALEGHLLILGWTNRTPEVVHEIVLAEGRVRRFQKRHGVRKLRIVVLAEQLSPELRLELKSLLGSRWHERQIVFRSGSSLRFEHLERVNALKAALIVIPGANFVMGGPAATDARVVKTILSLVGFGQSAEQTRFPSVVAEIFDPQTAAVTRDIYPGSIELISSDALIGRLLVQNVRHEGLSHVYGELLSHRFGNEVYIRPVPELSGATWDEVATRFTRAIPIGVVRTESGRHRALLDPPGGFRLGDDDRVVCIGGDFESTAPAPAPSRPVPARNAAPPVDGVERSAATSGRRTILVLGWSHKVRSLIEEFSRHRGEHFDIDLLSLVPAAERERALANCAIDAGRVRVRHFEGDYTLAADLRAHELRRYDTLMILGSDWLESDAASDARTILGYVQLRSLLSEDPSAPKLLVELMDPDNERLFVQRLGEVIVSPLLLSHMLAHVALRPELGAVFDELFGPSSSEFVFRAAGDYDLVGRRVSFEEVRHRSKQRGEIALGIRVRSGDADLRINPLPEASWQLTDRDEILVLANDTSRGAPSGAKRRFTDPVG